MVWGMALPSGFGDFFPDGDYIGWYEALEKYFFEQMPLEEQKQFIGGSEDPYEGFDRYSSFVNENFREPLGKSYREEPPFRLARAPEAPPEFKTLKTYSSLGSLIKMTARILAVDEALKGIIEAFEPGLHQFFPIRITMPRNQVYPKQYYTIRIGQYLNSFSPEQSKEGAWKDRGLGYYSSYIDNKASLTGLAFSKSIFGNAHLWRESYLISPVLQFSDALQAAISNAGLCIPKHYKAMEV